MNRNINTEEKENRLLAGRKIDPSGCWLWTGNRAVNGYGRMFLGHTQPRVHRLAWELWCGIIPSGMVIHHRCGTKHCFNPDHLELTRHAEHVSDHRQMTHCKQGHEFTESNTYRYLVNGKPHRACRACKALDAIQNQNRRKWKNRAPENL